MKGMDSDKYFKLLRHLELTATSLVSEQNSRKDHLL